MTGNRKTGMADTLSVSFDVDGGTVFRAAFWEGYGTRLAGLAYRMTIAIGFFVVGLVVTIFATLIQRPTTDQQIEAQLVRKLEARQHLEVLAKTNPEMKKLIKLADRGVRP